MRLLDVLVFGNGQKSQQRLVFAGGL